MERDVDRTTIVVAGADSAAERWASAFRGVEGVDVERVEGTGEDDLLASLSRRGVDAAAFVAPMGELAGAVKRSLMAQRHVFVAGEVALSPKQLLAIDGLARRRDRAIVFDAATPGPHLAFARKMVAGPAAIWRPRYIRSVRTSLSAGETLDEIAISEAARVLAVAEGVPRAVHGFSPRIDDESGRRDAAMMMLSFDGGTVAQIDVSLIEPSPRHEMVIACDGRTIVLDALDVSAPLRIDAAARHRGPRREGEWAETVSEHPTAEIIDDTRLSAPGFVAAVRGRGFAKASNARRLADAARVWEAARESMSRGGEGVEMGVDDAATIERRRFRVIEGGGHTDGRRSAPELTLVARS